MNIIEYITLEDAIENGDPNNKNYLYNSRAKYDKMISGQSLTDDDDEHDFEPEDADVPEDYRYDLDSMDEEYVRKAQETKVNRKSDLKYVQMSENGFPGLGAPIG